MSSHFNDEQIDKPSIGVVNSILRFKSDGLSIMLDGLLIILSHKGIVTQPKKKV